MVIIFCKKDFINKNTEILQYIQEEITIFLQTQKSNLSYLLGIKIIIMFFLSDIALILKEIT